MRHLVLFAAFATVCAGADLVNCPCDASRSESLQARQCSLCREAEKQPADTRIFFLKDINPTKQNRWLALPRVHDRTLDLLPADWRTDLLRAAMEKAKELFKNEWAIAYNAPEIQTQCHVHVHIGKWMPAVEDGQFTSVQHIVDVSVPAEGRGFWIHPVGGILHVHAGELITETVLVR